MSLWRSVIGIAHFFYIVWQLTSPFSTYRSLTPKTRALFGVGVMAWATIGLWTSPQVESALGMQASKEEQEALDRQMAVRISRAGADDEKGSQSQ